MEDVVGRGVKNFVGTGGGGFEIETAVVGVLLAGFALELGVERQGLFVGINVNVVVDVDGSLFGLGGRGRSQQGAGVGRTVIRAFSLLICALVNEAYFQQLWHAPYSGQL